MSDPGNPVGIHLSPSMTPLTTDSIASELLEESMLTLEQVSTWVTVLAIIATWNPEQVTSLVIFPRIIRCFLRSDPRQLCS